MPVQLLGGSSLDGARRAHIRSAILRSHRADELCARLFVLQLYKEYPESEKGGAGLRKTSSHKSRSFL